MQLTKEEISKIIGQKIRAIRNGKKKTIEHVALDAEIEYTQLSRIERGKINTGIYHIYKISNSLGIRIHEIFLDMPRNKRELQKKNSGKSENENF